MTEQESRGDELVLEDLDLYLPRERRFSRKWWIVAGVAGLLVLALAAGGLVLAVGAGTWPFGAPTEAQPLPTRTAVRPALPTVTPLPVANLSLWSQTDPGAPVGMIEVALSLPVATRVSLDLPAGLRYWSGDLLQAGDGFAYTAGGPEEVTWFLFREPGATFALSLTISLDGRATNLVLQADTSTTLAIPLD